MHRTGTRDWASFSLPFPDAVVFTFASSEPTPHNEIIRITIHPSGNWKMPLHWHPSESPDSRPDTRAGPGCERLSCVDGSLHVFVAEGISSNYDKFGSKGMVVNFSPGQRVQWDRPRHAKETPLTVDLVANPVLWRNICSAVLDADKFPRLESTPWWLKALFAILRPAWHAWLLGLTLRIQLLAIFASHDLFVYHGYIPVTWPWMYQPWGGRPPVWAKWLQLRSMFLISSVVMRSACLVGTWCMGMKGQYPEYTPR